MSRERKGNKETLDNIDTSTDVTVRRIHESLQIDGDFKPTDEGIRIVIAKLTQNVRRRRNRPRPSSRS